MIEWNKLDSKIRNSVTINIFKSKILRFIRLTANSIFGCQNPIGVKLLTIVRLGLSYLREHKFRHSFQDTLNPLCSCRKEVETTFHFLLSCPNYSDPNTLENTNSQIIQFGDNNSTASIDTASTDTTAL